MDAGSRQARGAAWNPVALTGGVEGAVEAVGRGVGQYSGVGEHHERLDGRAKRGGVGAAEEQVELRCEQLARLIARGVVVAEWDGAVDAGEDGGEHTGAKLALGRARAEEGEEDEEEGVRQLRLGAGEDELIHEHCGVIPE